MAHSFSPGISEIQFSILDFYYRFYRGDWWPPSFPVLCNTIQCQNSSLVSDALQLLADEGQVTIRQWRGNSFATYQKGMDWGSFIYRGGNFEFKPNATGRRRHEELESTRFRDLGASGANKVVRDTVVKLQDVLSGCGDLRFASLSIRILEELVRIGVRNYQDITFATQLNAILRELFLTNAKTVKHTSTSHFSLMCCSETKFWPGTSL